MTKGKKITIFVIAVITVVMIAIVCYFMMKVDVPLIDNISFVDKVNNLKIEPYYDDTDDVYYVFIPSYVTAENIQVQKSDFIKLKFLSDTGDYGKELKSLPINKKVTLSLKNFKTSEEYTFEFRQNANIPTLYLETESGSLDYINETEGNKEDTSVLLIDPNGVCAFSSMATMEGRGNSTWWQAKKPYNLKFDDKVNLIGSQSSNKWALLANYSDSSEIRNALSYYLGEELGFKYTSEINYVSLYVNGNYMGLYTTAIKGYKADDSATNIFEQSRSNKDYDWISENDGYYIFRLGAEEYIKEKINKFENALFSEDATYDEISQYINVESFANKYFLETFVQNEDDDLSQYFVIDGDGKIKAVNPWDYDLTFGIAWSPYYDFSSNSTYMSNIWYSTLFTFDEFKNEVTSLIFDYNDLINVNLNDKIDELEALLENDWYNNYIRWHNEVQFRAMAGDNNTQLHELNYDFTSFKDNCQYIKQRIADRYEFLKEYWSNIENYHIISFYDDTIIGTNSSVNVCIRSDSKIKESDLPTGILDIETEGFCGWYTDDGISINSITKIEGDLSFYARWQVETIQENTTTKNEAQGNQSSVSDIQKADNKSFILFVESLIKKIYSHSGLDVLGNDGIIFCGIFGLLLIVLILVEFVRLTRQRRNDK